MKSRLVRAVCGGIVAVGAWTSSSCSPSGFSSQSLIQSVRILGASADQPFARPGERVNVTFFAFDGRSAADRSGAPLNLDWIPTTGPGEVVPCVNPASDAYYACYPELGASSLASPSPSATDSGVAVVDAGIDFDAGGAGLGSLDACAPDGAPCVASLDTGAPDACPSDGAACATSADASIAQPVMSTAAFTMPLDIVTSHPPVAGTSPYGLAIVFNMACTGHVQFVPPSSSIPNPQQAPVGCFDDAGTALGSDDYVLGLTRVYSRLAPDGGYYTNANPVISGIHLPPCTLAVQGSVPSFTSPPITAICTPSYCPNVTFGAVVPESSWELNPLALDSQGNPQHEEIWVDYYSTFGGFSGQTRLLYSPTTGAESGSDTAFEPPALGPNDVHDGFIFAVVYDDRGGSSWASIPTHVCSDSNDPACACSDAGDAGCAVSACADGG